MMKKILFIFIFYNLNSHLNAQLQGEISAEVFQMLQKSRAVLLTDTLSALKIAEEARVMASKGNVPEYDDACRLKAEIYAALDSVELAKKSYLEAIQPWEKSGRTEKQLQITIEFGNYLFESALYNEAEAIYNEGIEFAVKQKQKSIEAEFRSGKARVNINRGNLHLAMSDLLTALEIFEKQKEKSGIAECWHQIGIIHWKEGKNNEAMQAYEKSLAIRSQLKDSIGIASSYSNIGVIHKLERRFDKAATYYSRALGIRKRFNDQKGIAQSLFNIGSLKYETGNTEEALIYYKRSLEIKEKIHDKYGTLSNYLNMGDASRKLKKYNEAEAFYLTGLNLSQQLGANDFSKSFYRELSLLSGIQEKYKDAYEYQVMYSALKDTLINEEKNRALAELQTRYDLSEKQRDIDRLEQKGKLDEEKEARDRNFRNSLIVIIILIVILVIVIYNRASRFQKVNKMLREQKNEIALREREKETLLREIHHRVKNNLQLTSSLLNLQARQVKDEEASRSLKEARDRVKAISLIHQKLYIRDQFSEVDIAEYIPELCKSIAQSNGVDNSKISFEFNLQQLLIPLDLAISLGLIINETVTNSVKHAFGEKLTGGIIRLNSENQPGSFLLQVSDNGSGISDKEKFNEGFGWQLIWSLVKKLDAKLTLENRNGTIIKMIIPLKK